MNDFTRKRRTAKQILLRRAVSKSTRNNNDTETTAPFSKAGITVLPSLSRDPKLVRAMQRTISRSSRERTDRRPKSQARPKILKNSIEYPLLKQDSRSWRKLKSSDGPRNKHLMEGKSGVSLGGAPSRGSSRSRYSSSAYPSTWAMDVRIQEENAQETSNSLEEVTNCTPLYRTPYDHQLSTPLKSDQSVLCSMKAAARRLRQRRTKQPQAQAPPQAKTKPNPQPKPQPRAMCVAQTQTLPKRSAMVEAKITKYKPPKKSYKTMFAPEVEEKFLRCSRSPSKTSENSFSVRKIRHRVSSGDDVKRSMTKQTSRKNQLGAPQKRDLTDYGGYTPSDVSLAEVPIKQMSYTEMPRGTGGHKNDDSRWTMLLPTERDIQKYINEAAFEDCVSCSARDCMPQRYDESGRGSTSLDSSESGHCICERGAKKSRGQSLSRSGSRASTTDYSSSRLSSQSRRPRHKPMTRQGSYSSISNEPRSSNKRTRDRPNRDSRRSRNRSLSEQPSFTTDPSQSSIVNRKEFAKSQRNSQGTSRRASDNGRAKSRDAKSNNASRRYSRRSERRSSHRENRKRRSSVEVIPVEIGAENLRKKASQKNSMHSLNQSSGHSRKDFCKDPKCRRKCRRCMDASTLTSEHLITAAATGLNSRRGSTPNNGDSPGSPPYRGATNSCGICPVTKICDPKCAEASRRASQRNAGSFNANATNSCGICPVTKICDPKCIEAYAQTSQPMMMQPSRSRASMDMPNNLMSAQRSQFNRSQTGGRSPNVPPNTAIGTVQEQGSPCCFSPNCQMKCAEAGTQTCPSSTPRRLSTNKAKRDYAESDECDVRRIIEILQTALAGLEMEQRARMRGSTSRLVDGVPSRTFSGRQSDPYIQASSRTSLSRGPINASNVDNSYASEATDGTYIMENAERQFDPYQHKLCYCPNDMYYGASNLTGPSIPFLNVESMRPETKRVLQYINKISGKREAVKTPIPTVEKRTKPGKKSAGHVEENKKYKSSEKFVHLLGQSKNEREGPHSSNSKSSYVRYNVDRILPTDNRKNRKSSALKSYLGAKQRFTQSHLVNKFRQTRGRSKVREILGSYCPVLGIKSKKRSNIFLMRPTTCSKYVPIRHEPDSSNYKKCLISQGRTENYSLSEAERRKGTCCKPENSIGKGQRRGRTRCQKVNCMSEGELRGRTRFSTENTLSEGELRGGARSPAHINRTRDSDQKFKNRSIGKYNRDSDSTSKRRPSETAKRQNTGKTSVTTSFLNAYEAQIFKDFEKYRETIATRSTKATRATRSAEPTASAEKLQQDRKCAAEADKSICQQEPKCSYLQYQKEQQKAAVAPKICLQDPICQHCKLMQQAREERVREMEKSEQQTRKKVSLFSMKEKKKPEPKKSVSKSSIQEKQQSKESEISEKSQRKEKKPSKSKGIFSWCLKKDKGASEEKLKKDGKLKDKTEKKNSEQNEETPKESPESPNKIKTSEAPKIKFQVVDSDSPTLLKKSPSSQAREDKQIPEQSQPISQPIPAKTVIAPDAKTFAQTTSSNLKPAVNFYYNERTGYDARNEVRVLYDSSARFARDTCSVRVLPDTPIPTKPRFGDYPTSSCSSIGLYHCYGGQQKQQQQEFQMPNKVVSTNAFYSMFQEKNPFLKKRSCDCEFERKWDIF